jgi:hypothetical protein
VAVVATLRTMAPEVPATIPAAVALAAVYHQTVREAAALVSGSSTVAEAEAAVTSAAHTPTPHVRRFKVQKLTYPLFFYFLIISSRNSSGCHRCHYFLFF